MNKPWTPNNPWKSANPRNTASRNWKLVHFIASQLPFSVARLVLHHLPEPRLVSTMAESSREGDRDRLPLVSPERAQSSLLLRRRVGCRWPPSRVRLKETLGKRFHCGPKRLLLLSLLSLFLWSCSCFAHSCYGCILSFVFVLFVFVKCCICCGCSKLCG